MFEDVTDDTLRAEARALEEELAALRRRPRRFRSDAHETLDLSVKAAQDRVDALLKGGVYQLSRSTGSAIGIPGLADAVALTDPKIVKRWRALIDAEPAGDNAGSTFVSLDRAEYTAERTRLEGEIRDRARELARRIEERRHEAAVAELGDQGETNGRATRLEQGDPGYGAQVDAQQEVETHA